MPTIQKRGDTYRIRVSAGYDAAGKQIMKSTTWKPAPGMTPKQIQKELDRQAVLFEEKVKSGRCMETSAFRTLPNAGLRTTARSICVLVPMGSMCG